MSIIDQLNKMEEGKPIFPSELYENFKIIAKYLEDSVTNIDNLYNTRMTDLAGQFSPVGIVIGFPSDIIPAGYKLCDGSLLAISEYQELYNVIGTFYNKETDTDDKMFRLPDFRGIFLRGAGKNDEQETQQAGDFGALQKGAAPNIKGGFKAVANMEGSSSIYGTSGAFNYTNFKTGKNCRLWESSGNRQDVTFDASRSNEVYQDDVIEIRPTNQAVNWIIKYTSTI